MTSFMLIWILLQKIEKLEEELNTYKNNTNKNWFISSGQLPTVLFFAQKRYVIPTITYRHYLMTNFINKTIISITLITLYVNKFYQKHKCHIKSELFMSKSPFQSFSFEKRMLLLYCIFYFLTTVCVLFRHFFHHWWQSEPFQVGCRLGWGCGQLIRGAFSSVPKVSADRLGVN